MSERAYNRFMASYMLTAEESLPQNKQEIIDYTEDVLDARGIECDERISKMSDEEIKDVLEEVRRLRAKKKKKQEESESEKEQEQEQEIAAEQTA
jgi:hypothetical protein